MSAVQFRPEPPLMAHNKLFIDIRMDLIEELRKNPFVLAPMAAITDCAFRSFMREMGAGIVTTELVSATGLRHSSEKTRRIMQFTPDQHPVGVQLFGDNLDDLQLAAKDVEQMGANFVDLNFGCPVQKVVKKGAGSAALKDLVHFRDILRAVKSATQLPVTIKVRTGWDYSSRNTDQVAQIAYDEGITWVAIHGRTRAQAYEGEADWNYIAEVKSKAPLPIIGNGDVTSAQKACTRLKESGCDAVMIGRGCLKNPWIFQEAQALWSQQEASGRPGAPVGGDGRSIQRDFVWMIERLRFHLESFWDERMIALQAKKFAAWFSTGYPGAAQFRKGVFQIKTKVEVFEYILNYLDSIREHAQIDTSHERFLMGGHG